MLIKDYDIEEVLNQNDIEECIVDILRKWKGEENIRRLHFHFSGHGIINQTYEPDDTDQVMDADTPTWHCLVGNNGDSSLHSVHQIKHLLNQANPDFITITLDCNRSLDHLRQNPRKRFSFGKLPIKLPQDNWPKMATIYSTCDSQASYDENSFSKELWKVYQEQDHHIPITKVAKLVNDSWGNRMVNQVCTMEIINIGDNWKNKYWPV